VKQDNDLEKARLARAFSASGKPTPCTGVHCAICWLANAGADLTEIGARLMIPRRDVRAHLRGASKPRRQA